MRARRWLGRAFGTSGWDPYQYSQWTEFLVIRPLVLGLPAGVLTILGMVIAIESDASGVVTVAVVVVSALVGYALGGLLWSWLERRRRSAS